jgi:hypothetical protein
MAEPSTVQQVIGLATATCTLAGSLVGAWLTVRYQRSRRDQVTPDRSPGSEQTERGGPSPGPGPRQTAQVWTGDTVRPTPPKRRPRPPQPEASWWRENPVRPSNDWSGDARERVTKAEPPGRPAPSPGATPWYLSGRDPATVNANRVSAR